MLCPGQGLRPRACEFGGTSMIEKLKAAFPPFRLCLYRQFARVFLLALSLEPTSRRLTKMETPGEQCVIRHWMTMEKILVPARDRVIHPIARSNGSTSSSILNARSMQRIVNSVGNILTPPSCDISKTKKSPPLQIILRTRPVVVL